MKLKLAVGLLLSLTAVLALRSNARPARETAPHERIAKAPLKLIGVIAIPGNPLVSSDIAWVDAGTKRFYLSDRSNLGIDIIDAENDLYVGRVTGFAGPNNGATPPPNGQGPNGVVVTPDKKVWAGDGDSTVRVADVDPNSPNYLKIIQSV